VQALILSRCTSLVCGSGASGGTGMMMTRHRGEKCGLVSGCLILPRFTLEVSLR
jgi:hypothetical protein